MGKRVDYTDMRIGDTIIIRRIEGTRQSRWLCVCGCGDEFIVWSSTVHTSKERQRPLQCLECSKKGEKRCIKCHFVKPLTDYYTHPKARDGRQQTCRKCDNKRTANTNANMQEREPRTPGFECRECFDLYHRIPIGSRCIGCGHAHERQIVPRAVEFLGRREMAHGVRHQSGMRGTGL